jgi:hypothetical protein
MRVLACVKFHDQRVQQSWEMIDGEKPFLIISESSTSKWIALPLERERLHPTDGYLLADYVYLGHLDVIKMQFIDIPVPKL